MALETDCKGFLDAICADPHDIGLRLIYADALDDAGDTARAEFIRVQVELATGKFPCTCTCEYEHGIGCPEGRQVSLRRRERELLSEYGSRWAGDIAVAFGFWRWGNNGGTSGPNRPAVRWEFRRGFVEKVSCTCADWLQHGPAIVRCQPVLTVTLSGYPSNSWPRDQDMLAHPIQWARGPHPERGLAALPPLEDTP